MKYKVLFVTGTRAEYGIMRPLLRILQENPEVELDLVVTGTHLEKKYGETISQIIADDFSIIRKVYLNLKDTQPHTIGESLSKLTRQLNDVYSEKSYNLVLLLGDRYEMLPVANLAVLYQVPICHIHGGELTYGNYDEHIRHAITKMSSIHLTSTKEYKKRVISMGEDPSRVFDIGAMGVENAINNLMSREKLIAELGVYIDDYFVVLYHPATLHTVQQKKEESDLIINFIKSTTKKVVVIGNNADTGADIFRNDVSKLVDNQRVFMFSSLPSNVFQTLVKYSNALVGNSSAGIIEAPSLGIPTINVGNRQKGRVRSRSVIDVPDMVPDITAALNSIKDIDTFSNPYYKKGSVDLANTIILDFLKISISSAKEFYEAKGGNLDV